jgi:hypothetical protein
MRAMVVLGLLLILLGIALLSYQYMYYTTASGLFQSARTVVP